MLNKEEGSQITIDFVKEKIDSGQWIVDTLDITHGYVSRNQPSNRQFVEHHQSGKIEVTIKITDPVQTMKAKQFLNGCP